MRRGGERFSAMSELAGGEWIETKEEELLDCIRRDGKTWDFERLISEITDYTKFILGGVLPMDEDETEEQARRYLIYCNVHVTFEAFMVWSFVNCDSDYCVAYEFAMSRLHLHMEPDEYREWCKDHA
jgi:hypothetical protein